MARVIADGITEAGANDVVERGSNANGEYVKYANGIIECFGTATADIYSSTSLIYADVTLPHPILKAYTRGAIPVRTGIVDAPLGVYPRYIESSAVGDGVMRIGWDSSGLFTSGESIPFYYHAKGRWF